MNLEPTKVPWSVMLDGYAYYRRVCVGPGIEGDEDGHATYLKACKEVELPASRFDAQGNWDLYEFKPSAHYGGSYKKTKGGGWASTVLARVSVCRNVFVMASDEEDAYLQAYRFHCLHPLGWPEAWDEWTFAYFGEMEECEAEKADFPPAVVWAGA